MKYLVFIFLAASVSASFTDDYYQILAKEAPDENLISSPLSVEIVMAMLYMGAKGNTAKELQTALKLPEDRNEVANKYREFFTNLEGREKDAILELANRIYVNDQFKLVPEYNKIVADSFKAEAVPINMDKNAAANINTWVSGHTRNKITEIVSPEILDDAITILINAIYFKGQWKYKFEKARTHKEIFHTAKDKKVEVDMMNMESNFMANTFPDLDAKVIELPYRNSSLYMQIFLPNKIDGLSKLESQIGGFNRKLYKQPVILKIPKFKIESTKSLGSLLKQLGIKTMFGMGADLSGLISGRAQVSGGIQKAFVEVNEEGAEAAAVTAVVAVHICANCATPSRMSFIADHPFAYVIRDSETIFFQGHYVQP
ncbi:serine protease inhibitor 42Dd [Drosophila ananassae]|uniref:serine protease inhibitor 42Dd n=1 Tax=Drosophila ananassae TaxID=7217 RepID=UPI0013A5ED31|nr:serine protease inhibitor 42Dd [Drosophila ananassae]